MSNAPPITPTTVTCIGCGYDLSGTAIGATCPECGMAVATSLQPRLAGERSNSTATTCFVLGLVSLAVGCLILGPIAVALYYKARAEFNRGGYSSSSQTLAKAGLVLGIISTCILGVYAAILVLAGLQSLW